MQSPLLLWKAPDDMFVNKRGVIRSVPVVVTFAPLGQLKGFGRFICFCDGVMLQEYRHGPLAEINLRVSFLALVMQSR